MPSIPYRHGHDDIPPGHPHNNFCSTLHCRLRGVLVRTFSYKSTGANSNPARTVCDQPTQLVFSFTLVAKWVFEETLRR